LFEYFNQNFIGLAAGNPFLHMMINILLSLINGFI